MIELSWDELDTTYVPSDEEIRDWVTRTLDDMRDKEGALLYIYGAAIQDNPILVANALLDYIKDTQ